MPNAPALHVENLSVRYSGEENLVLDRVSLSLEPGHFYLLSGPSGGGKSTLLAALNGSLHVGEAGEFSGSLSIQGTAAAPSTAERAHQIGSVLQDANAQILFPYVEDELAFPLENLGLSPETMAERVPAVAAAQKLDLRAPSVKLSGGQKQRLTAAATLAMGQKILLLDEPLASLDAQGAELLLKQLQQLVRDEAYSVLFIEHRIDWVLPYADRFFWLDQGQIQSFDTAEAFECFFNREVLAALSQPEPLPPARQHAAGGIGAPGQMSAQKIADQAEQPLLALEGVSFKAGGKSILNDIHFRLYEGERYVIHGENGAGKSTFLMLLAGLLKPSQGRRYCHFKARQERSAVGLVMQDPSYQLFLPTVEDELRFQSKDPAVLDRLIEIFEFQPLLKRHPHSLSEGQKRRLGFAVILSMLPEVLLLDEPTVGQDYRSLQKLLAALSELYRERPLTLLTLTHDERCGQFFGDNCLLIEDGQLKHKC